MKKITIFIFSTLFVLSLAACNAKENKAVNVLESTDTLIAENDLKTTKANHTLGFQLDKPEAGEEIAVITLKNGESFKLRFFPEEAPKTVYNFKKHAIDGYYNGLTFHRIISNFMIQGGDPEGTGIGGESVWKKDFADEFSDNLININGSVAMANKGPNTNGSQFFINNTQTSGDIDWDAHQQYYDLLKSDPDSFAYYTGGRTSWIDMKKAGDSYRELYDKHGGNPNLDGAYSTESTGHTVFAQVFEGMDIVNKISNVKTGANDVPVDPVIIESIEIIKYQ